jgi:hypothetical protein
MQHFRLGSRLLVDFEDLATIEFTMSGALVAADPIRWPVDVEPEQMFELNGWRFAGALGDREPPGDSVSANFFMQEETGEVLVDLLALGVSAWVLCRSQTAYLTFLLDWLRPLAELNRPGAASERLDQAIGRPGDTLADQLEDLLGEPERPREPREAALRRAGQTAAEASDS